MPAMNQQQGEGWSLYHGDCVEIVKELPTASVDFQIFSPPFGNYYIYSDHLADMGNCRNNEEFFAQFDFLIPELLRVQRPGRICAVHCKDMIKYANRDGRAGFIDFPGEIIRHFEAVGWQYHSRVTIWKDPLTEMERTKAQGLLHAQIVRDSSYCRQGQPDYLVIFRKWDGKESEVPIAHPKGFTEFRGDPKFEPGQPDDADPKKNKYSHYVWQRYASPVWMDVNQMDVLNARQARDSKDEKHICPLQLGVIDRCIELWSNPGDVILSPFAGIGSEGYVSIRRGRKFIGAELKETYWKTACDHLRRAEAEKGDLFEQEAA